MSNPQNEQDEHGRRKSKRQRVPNPYYTAGINQLKKITFKAQSKKNRTDEDDDYSSEDERNISNNQRNYGDNYHNNQRTQGSSGWLSCIMPNSSKPIRIQIVVDSTPHPIQNEPIRYKEEPNVRQQLVSSDSQLAYIPSYNSGPLPKKAEPQGGLNLLSLFQKVIKNVADEVPSPVKHPHINPVSYHHSNILEEAVLKYQPVSQKPSKQAVLAPPPKRIVEEDKDGRILSLTVDKQHKAILINHSRIGECFVPIEVEPATWKMKDQKNQEDDQTVQEFKRKIASNPGLLTNIAIYN